MFGGNFFGGFGKGLGTFRMLALVLVCIGGGILLTCFLPPYVLAVVMSIAVIVLGIIILKC